MTARVFPIEALDRWFQHRMLDVHTAIPCEVIEYDAAAQTVTARPQVKRYVLNAEGARTAEDLPDLYGVPVAFPRAGGFHMSFPLAAGDYVLVLFSEEPTQAWRSKARQVAPGFLDRHGLNGPFALPCGFPDAQKLSTAPPTDAVEIASDNAAGAVVVKDGTVLVGDATATDSASLDSKIQDELDRLKGELDTVKTFQTNLKTALGAMGSALVTPTGIDASSKTTFTTAVTALAPVSPASPGATAAAKVKLK